METKWGAKHIEWINWVLSSFVNRHYRRLLDGLDLGENLTILELGAGTGRNSFNMAAYLDVLEIVLVDLNADRLKRSNELYRDRDLDVPISFLQRDVFSLKLDKRFDIVHSYGFIEHFSKEDQEKLIRIHCRFAKEGGHIIIFVPIQEALRTGVKKFGELLNIYPWPDENPLRRDEYIRMLMKNMKIARELHLRLQGILGIIGRMGAS